MHITCLQENLQRGLQTVSKIVGSKTTLPILKNILLETKDGRLKISATDLEIGITSFIGAKIEKSGSITVPAKLLIDYVNTLPNKKVSLEVKNNTLRIECENYKASLNTISAEEFPEIPQFPEVNEIKIHGKEFLHALQKVIFSCSRDDSRPVLSAIYMSLEDQSLTIVAADGFRLAEKTITLPEAIQTPLSLLIPYKSLLELLRITPTDEESISIYLNQNQVLFKTTTNSLFTRLIEGKFPDYKSIIPSDDPSATIGTINLEEFEKAIRTNYLFAKDDSDAIKLEFVVDKSAIIVSASTSQLGESNTTVEATIKGKSEVISFNAKYLLDVLPTISQKEVVIQITTKLNPGIIRDPDDKHYVYVVMPVKQL